MADFSLGTELTSTQGSPTIYYTLTLKSKTRTSNSQMKYVFNVHTRMGGTLGTGYSLTAYVNGYSVVLKTTSESMSTWKSGYTKDSELTCYVSSTTGNATQTLTFRVDRSDGEGYGGYLSSKTFNVTSSALLYTDAGAPTSISVSTSIVKPSTDFTISWSGATGGTNNSITGYNLYYTTDGTTPTTSSTSISISSTASSYTYTFTPGSTRGTVYTFKVLTKGSAGSSYYSDLSGSASTVINTLPAAPTVAINRATVPYLNGQGASRTYTATLPDSPDVDTSQTLSLYYATSPTGTKTSFTSPLTYNVKGDAGDEVILYFWTYDGLEYSSSYTAVSAYINTLPTITSLNVTASDYTYNNYSLTHLLSGSVTANAGEQASSIKSYTWYYSTDGETLSTLNITSGNFSDYDMITLLGNGQNFGIGVTAKDNFNDVSELQWFDGSSFSDSFSLQFVTALVTPTVTITNVYNSSSAADVTGTTPGNFYQNMYITWTQPAHITYDYGYFPISNYTIIINDTEILTTDGATNNATLSSLVFDVGTNLTVSVRTNDEAGGTATTSVSSITRNNTEYTLVECGPPLIEGTLNFSIVSPYRVYYNDSNTSTLTINLSSLPTNTYDNGIVLTCSVKETLTNTVITNLNLTLNDAYYSVTISRADLKTAFETALDTNPINTDYPCILTLTSSNNFGQIGSTITVNYTFKFKEAPVFDTTLAYNVCYYGQSSYVTLSNPSENIYPMINTGDIIRLILTGNNNNTPATDPNNNIDRYEIHLCRTDTDSQPSTGYEFYRNLDFSTYNANVVNIDIEMPQYTISKFLWFRIYAVDTDGLYSDPIDTTQVIIGCRIQKPVISLTSIEEENDALTATWQLTDLGDNKFNSFSYEYTDYANLERIGYPATYINSLSKPIIKLQYGSDPTFATSTLTDNLNTAYSGDGNDFNFSLLRALQTTNTAVPTPTSNIYARIVVALPTSTVINNSTTSAPDGQVLPDGTLIKTTDIAAGNETVLSYIIGFSNTLVFYANAPTVAYRENMLGINTNNFTYVETATPSETVMLISNIDTKHLLYLTGLPTASSSRRYATIDLNTGEIDNFIIESGSWD